MRVCVCVCVCVCERERERDKKLTSTHYQSALTSTHYQSALTSTHYQSALTSLLSLADVVMVLEKLLPKPEPNSPDLFKSDTGDDRLPQNPVGGGVGKYDKVELSH